VKEAPRKTYQGTVVGVAGGKLTTTSPKGKERCHTLAADAQVTCDGLPGTVADLKAGTPVRVTADQDDRTVATAVESGKHIPATVLIT
jgi:hypothetical protein